MSGQIINRRSFGKLLVALTLPGCNAALQAKVEQQGTELTEIKGQLSRMRDELEQFRSTNTLEINTIWGRLECSNDRVKRFLGECEKGSETCSEDGLANALAFMDSQAHTTLYLAVSGSVKPVAFRTGHLGMLTEARNLHPTTRFLVLVQPRADGPEFEREAKRMGDDVKDYLRRNFRIPSNIKIMGPLTLPCRLKSEQLKSYMSRNDRPRLDEPGEKEGRLRVWIFRTDC